MDGADREHHLQMDKKWKVLTTKMKAFIDLKIVEARRKNENAEKVVSVLCWHERRSQKKKEYEKL